MRVLLPILLLVFVSLSYGSDSITYYVNPTTGSDSNSGTSTASPFLTISAAIQASGVDQADLTVISLFPGTYNGTGNVQQRFRPNTQVVAQDPSNIPSVDCLKDDDNVLGFQGSGNFTVENVNFQRCSSCISFDAQGGFLAVSGCGFGAFSDVGININSADGIDISNCDFSGGNKASVMASQTKSINIRRCQFTDVGISTETVSDGEISDTDFTNVIGRENSNITQAIRIESGRWTIENVNIYRSEMSTGNNGESANGGAMELVNSIIDIRNSSFYDCHADNSGGVAYISDSQVTFDDCTFVNSTSEDMGGAIFSLNSDIEVYNSEFRTNIAHLGGGIALDGTSDAKLNQVQFTENEASTGSCVACCEESSQCDSEISEYQQVVTTDNVNIDSDGTDITCSITGNNASTTPAPSPSAGYSSTNDDSGMSTFWIVFLVFLSLFIVVGFCALIAVGVIFFIKKRQSYDQL